MYDPIVVTGLGAISPLGVGVERTWAGLIAGRSGIGPNTRFDTSGCKCRIAGLVPQASDVADGFDPELVMDAREVRRSDRFIHYAMGAAREALEQSGWSPEGHEE